MTTAARAKSADFSGKAPKRQQDCQLAKGVENETPPPLVFLVALEVPIVSDDAADLQFVTRSNDDDRLLIALELLPSVTLVGTDDAPLICFCDAVSGTFPNSLITSSPTMFM